MVLCFILTLDFCRLFNSNDIVMLWKIHEFTDRMQKRRAAYVNNEQARKTLISEAATVALPRPSPSQLWPWFLFAVCHIYAMKYRGNMIWGRSLVVKCEEGIMAALVSGCDVCVCECINKGTCTHNWPSVLLVPSLGSAV